MEAFLRGRTLRYDPIAPPDIDVEDNTSQCEFDLPFHSVVQKVKDILGYTACNLIQRREPVYHR
jgi:hypothetical protein